VKVIHSSEIINTKKIKREKEYISKNSDCIFKMLNRLLKKLKTSTGVKSQGEL